MPSYRQFEHTADLGIDIEADCLSDLFATAGLAFCELTAGRDALGAANITERIEASGVDLADLLVSFLSELLFMFDARSELLHEIDVLEIAFNSGSASIKAACHGRKFYRDSEQALIVIKAVTHHGARVEKEPGGNWEARILFDT